MANNDTHNIIAFVSTLGDSANNEHYLTKLLGGKPVLAYSIESLIAVIPNQFIYLLTHSQGVKQIAEAYGLRAHLLTSSTNKGCERKLIASFSQEAGADTVIKINPLYPFISFQTIEAAINLFYKNQSRCIVSTSPVVDHPYWCKQVTENGQLKNLSISDDSHSHQLPALHTVTDLIKVFSLSSLHINTSDLKKMKALVINSLTQQLKIVSNFEWMLANFYLEKYMTEAE